MVDLLYRYVGASFGRNQTWVCHCEGVKNKNQKERKCKKHATKPRASGETGEEALSMYSTRMNGRRGRVLSRVCKQALCTERDAHERGVNRMKRQTFDGVQYSRVENFKAKIFYDTRQLKLDLQQILHEKYTHEQWPQQTGSTTIMFSYFQIFLKKQIFCKYL